MIERKLRHADMVSVLKRSKLPSNFENLLLPLKEAISNARFACEGRFKERYADSGKIRVEIFTEPLIVRVSDNGSGLDEKNYESFLTPFTGNRLRKNGKGFGRFVTLKVFEDVFYSSISTDTDYEKIKFKFDVFADEELSKTTQEIDHPFSRGCTVEMRSLRSEFDVVQKSLTGEDVVASMLRTFLPRFLSNEMPSLEIIVDSAVFDANSEFRQFFRADHSTTIHVDFDGVLEPIKLDISKVSKGKGFKNNSLVFLGAGRVVGDNQNLDLALGATSFTDGEDKFVYVIAASGNALDKSVNTSRTMLEVSSSTMDTIARSAVQEILALEHEYVEERRKKQLTYVTNILQRNPLLRQGLNGKNLTDYISESRIGWKQEDFLQSLALQQHRNRRDFEADMNTAFKSPENYISMREDLLKQVEEEKKNALASYVVYRKDVLDLIQHTRSQDEDGKICKEDEIHDIIFQRFEDTDSKAFFEHNLWLVDERLSFFSYVASDRTSLGKRRKKGEKVADIAAFDECFILSQGENNDVLVLIEFKRPLRDDYKRGSVKRDPIEQVFATAESIRETGSFQSTEGHLVNVPAGVRIYGYVIADLTPTLKKTCVGRDMTLTWDGNGYYDFHKTFDTFVEVISYDKMISDARKRNAAFFKVLLGDLI